MTGGLFVLGLGCAIVFALVVWVGRRQAQAKRRTAAMARSFPTAWHDVLMDTMAVYPVLPESLRTDLQGSIQGFLFDTPFEGCGGLEVTDEIRVTIAAQACLLLIGRPNEGFPALTSVLWRVDLSLNCVMRFSSPM